MPLCDYLRACIAGETPTKEAEVFDYSRRLFYRETHTLTREQVMGHVLRYFDLHGYRPQHISARLPLDNLSLANDRSEIQVNVTVGSNLIIVQATRQTNEFVAALHTQRR